MTLKVCSARLPSLQGQFFGESLTKLESYKAQKKAALEIAQFSGKKEQESKGFSSFAKTAMDVRDQCAPESFGKVFTVESAGKTMQARFFHGDPSQCCFQNLWYKGELSCIDRDVLKLSEPSSHINDLTPEEMAHTMDMINICDEFKRTGNTGKWVKVVFKDKSIEIMHAKEHPETLNSDCRLSQPWISPEAHAIRIESIAEIANSDNFTSTETVFMEIADLIVKLRQILSLGILDPEPFEAQIAQIKPEMDDLEERFGENSTDRQRLQDSQRYSNRLREILNLFPPEIRSLLVKN